jgi:hypothetical protein
VDAVSTGASKMALLTSLSEGRSWGETRSQGTFRTINYEADSFSKYLQMHPTRPGVCLVHGHINSSRQNWHHRREKKEG